MKLKKRVTMLMLNKKMLALLKWKRNNLLKMMPKKFKKFKRTKQKVRMQVIKMETMRNLRMFP